LDINESKPVYFGNYIGFKDKFTLEKKIVSVDLKMMSESSSSSTSGGFTTTTSESRSASLDLIEGKISEALIPSSFFINNLNLSIKMNVTNYVSAIKIKNQFTMNASVLKGN